MQVVTKNHTPRVESLRISLSADFLLNYLALGLSDGKVSKSAEAGLTGMRRGLYYYPELCEPNPFIAILVQSRSTLSGTTHEPCMVRQMRGGVLYATLAGTVRRHGRLLCQELRPERRLDAHGAIRQPSERQRQRDRVPRTRPGRALGPASS